MLQLRQIDAVAVEAKAPTEHGDQEADCHDAPAGCSAATIIVRLLELQESAGVISRCLVSVTGCPSPCRRTAFFHVDRPARFGNDRTMREGPDVSIIAALIGNPASANMLMALLAGPALTATELAQESGLMLSTASGHLAKLEQAGLVVVERQGRHRYFRLAEPDVAIALEALMPVAARAGHLRVRTGPRDPELRRARSCYDHLAGDWRCRCSTVSSSADCSSRRHDRLHADGRGQALFIRRRHRCRGTRTRPAGALQALSRLERAPKSSRRRARRGHFRPRHCA